MSDQTLDRADAAVRRIVTNALNGAIELLSERRKQLDELADLLMKEETVDEDQITDLLGVPPVPDAIAPQAALAAADAE